MPKVEYEELTDEKKSEPSAAIKQRVKRAREIQRQRFNKNDIFLNSQMNLKHIKKYCRIDSQSRELLKIAMRQMNLSARSYHRLLKLSRTIADLAKEDNIQPNHIAEAIQYRPKHET